MECFAEDVQTNKPLNICRCCLIEGCYKDISTEYYFSGQKEVYEDMLQETFDVKISYQDGGGPSSGSRLICEECITKLRDAFSFKKKVVQSERNFAEHLVRLQQGLEDISNVGGPLKIETDDEEHPLVIEMDLKCDVDDHDGAADTSFEDADTIDSKSEGMPEKCSEVLVKKKDLPKRPRKRPKTKEDGRMKMLKNDDDWIKIAQRRGNGPILRQNSLKLIQNSTLCVFQWNKSRYRCFCCMEPFSDMNTLRDHTNKHTIQNIERRIISQQNRLVKVEISVLNCKLCKKNLIDLESLRNHLTAAHNINFELHEDLLVPFKIGTDLQCQICFQKFQVFRLLNIHMNQHFQKQVCHICGAGFSNLVFLNLHKTRSHRSLDCKSCDLTFTTKVEKRQHMMAVHNVKTERRLRFPCPYCEERFVQENLRVEHYVLKHGMPKPEFRCGVCAKAFITKSLCNNHVKNVHMKERKEECDVCHRWFYSRSDVSRHKVTHTGEKRYSCSVCSSLFATKDSLRRHLKRTHGGSV